MRIQDYFVGGIALLFALLALLAALTQLPAVYRLHSLRTIESRYGTTAARGFLLALATLMFATGTAIIAGVRPSYSEPADEMADPQPAP
ncbi:hypothetical protein SH139x_001594 [Planctomycetaceae bacterium SH139]